MNFRVDLQIFRGPLDLLLYLVRKHEVDIWDIPISRIIEQYLDYLEILEQIDINAVGDFLDMASTLIEIKSRMVLPRVEEVDDDVQEDPRDELVQRLLEYKRYKDAASMLEDRSRQWQLRFERVANDLPPRRIELADQPIAELELWDLVSSFGRVMRQNVASGPTNIVYDDTPITVYMERIHTNMVNHGKAAFSEMFEEGMHKSAMIGVFLAVLELVRHHSVRTEQYDTHGEIWLTRGENFSDSLDLSDVDTYGDPPAGGEQTEASVDESAA